MDDQALRLSLRPLRCSLWASIRDHVDHIVELADGGINDDHNLQPLCDVPCRRKRSSFVGPAASVVDWRHISSAGAERKSDNCRHWFGDCEARGTEIRFCCSVFLAPWGRGNRGAET